MTNPPPQGLCQECRFFVPREQHPRVGECRRYAPRPVIRSGETRVPAAYWPIVLDEEFCGEYQKMEAVS